MHGLAGCSRPAVRRGSAGDGGCLAVPSSLVGIGVVGNGVYHWILHEDSHTSVEVD